MLKKEWRDIFLPALLRLTVGPVLAVIYSVFAGTINETSALLLFIGYAVSVFWVAMHMGLNAFHSEFHDHAFEYLFTFPFKRSRLLTGKLVVRLFVLGFLFIIYFLLQNLLKLLSFLPPAKMQNSLLFNAFSFSLLVLSFFIISFFLSLVDWRSARPAMPFLILASHSLFGFFIWKLFRYLGHDVNQVELSSILLMVSTGVFFIFSFRKLERGTLGNGWRINSKKYSLLVIGQKSGRNWGLLRYEWIPVARGLMLAIVLIFIQGFLLNMIFINENGQGIFSDRATIYAVIAGMMLLMVAFSSGNSLFQNEFRFKALEYLLTFPLSLRQILLEKLLARVFVLVPAALVFMIYVGHFSGRISLHSGLLYAVLRPAVFPFWMALLLLNGFFLSFFEMKNIMALVSLANLYALILIPLALIRLLKHFAVVLAPQTMTVLAISSGLILTTTILAGAFFSVLPRFDLSTSNRYARAFGLFLFIVFTSMSLASLAIVLFV